MLDADKRKAVDCDKVEDLYESALLVVVNGQKFAIWMNGDEETDVTLGGKSVPSLRKLVENINKLATIATMSSPGGVQPDGTTTKVNALGVISVPTATLESLGLVKPDGTTITIDENGKISALSANIAIATPTTPGAVMPDGKTTEVNASGAISAIGGNLLMNDEIWITESGTFTAPVTGWYEVFLIGGGEGGYVGRGSNNTYSYANSGNSGDYKTFLVSLIAGQEVSVVVGAAGAGRVNDSGLRQGGITSFGEYSTVHPNATGFRGFIGVAINTVNGTQESLLAKGAGFGASDFESGIESFYGAGGTAYITPAHLGIIWAQNGAQGAIRLRFWNPAKANGPAPEPTLS